MSERFSPRQITSDPDVPNIGAFGGLSSASYQTTGDIIFCDKLINATVTNRNEVKRRRGSRILTTVENLSLSNANSANSYRFTFDGQQYLAIKSGRNISLCLLSSSQQLQKTITKANVFSVVSASEQSTFAVVIENDICYLIVCTQSTAPVVCVIKQWNVKLTSASGSSLIGTIANYPSGSLTAANTYLFSDNTYLTTSSVIQSTNTLTVVTPTAHGITTANNCRLHGFYWTIGKSANYYPGAYLYNSAIRRNSLPLDVNVNLPVEIFSNPIINESEIQDLSIETTQVWQTQNLKTFVKTASSQPATSTEFDFSDGSYTAGVNNSTTRTPAFVSFGALSAGGNNERVYLFRLREVIVAPGVTVPSTDLSVYYDGSLTAGINYYNASGSIATTDVKYFTPAFNNRPNLSSVVEIGYQFGNVVNLERSTSSCVLADGFSFPLYGLSAIASIDAGVFPNLVLSVGNRVVFSGKDNSVIFSNADWSYRGVSWNNFQISTINFSATSAYSITMAQGSSKVLGLASVNGVVIVATDSGIFRISGDSVSSPPTATQTTISRLSNEVVNSSDCLLVYESRVFFISNNGLYQLQFSQDTGELALTPISVQVNDYFRRTPISLSYSSVYRAFVIGFLNSSELLVYSFESEAFTSFKFTFTPVNLRLSQTLDGFLAVFSQVGNNCLAVCLWDNNQTTDIANASTLAANVTVVGSSLTVGANPVDCSSICTPAELVGLYSSNLVQAYGDNHTRSLSGTVNINEHSGGRVPAPILTFVVSKAYMSDKLIRSHRVRAVNLLCAGTGELFSTLVLPNQQVYRSQQIERTQINLNPGLVKPGLNNNTSTRIAVGDLVNVRLRYAGVNESWALALQLTQDLLLIGWQLDTSVKKRGRVN